MPPSTYRLLIKRLISGLFIAVLVVCQFDGTHAQNRKELERQRKQKEREIQQTRKKLSETSKKEKQTLKYLKNLSDLIDQRQSLIGTMQTELTEITTHIGEEADIVNALDQDVADLKADYARLMYFMYKNRRATSTLSFVFATNSFNDALRRIKFIQFYTSYRENQVDIIMKTEASLSSRITDLKEQQTAKQEVLTSLADEEKSLENDKREQAGLMKQLKQDEKGLKKQLADQQRVAKKLDNAIRNAIRKEIAEATKRSGSKKRGRGANKDKTVFRMDKKSREPEALETTPEIAALSSKFAGNKAHLPWPVEKGSITEHFGTHPHPTISRVTVNCSGVIIKAAEGARARCIFGGKVTSVISIPGANNAVIVNHGSYFTVYSNLDQVFVHKGQQITTKQEIGTVGFNRINGETEIELQIWKAPDQKLDPEVWLQRR